MQPLIFDVECTGSQRNKANPFDPRNKMCCVSSYAFNWERPLVQEIEYADEPYQHHLEILQGNINAADILVGFNLKFDIHWVRRYHIFLNDKVRVWDCQLFYFIQSNQTKRFPSLNDVALHYNLPTKLDIVATEYWDKGLDTDQVPWDILSEYAAYDAELTGNIFKKQYEEFQQLPKNRQNLILLHMRDLLVLEEMEFNGSKYNVDLSLSMGHNLEREIADIDRQLFVYCPNTSISFNSDHQLSAFLYGGTVYREGKEDYTFTYVDGRTAIKQRKTVVPQVLPKIFKPLKGTSMAKDGVFSVAQDTLKTLKQQSTGFKKKILELLLLRAKLEKQKSTYCFGTPKLMNEMQWQDNLLHGNLNQCAVITGRLSCNKPNLQNQDGKMKICFESRF